MVKETLHWSEIVQKHAYGQFIGKLKMVLVGSFQLSYLSKLTQSILSHQSY